MNTLLKILILCFILNINTFAKSSYANKASKHEIIQIIKKELLDLVKEQRLSQTWLNAEFSQFRKKIIRKKIHYITALTNKKNEKKNNKLYFEVDTFGKVRGIYYSSKNLL